MMLNVNKLTTRALKKTQSPQRKVRYLFGDYKLETSEKLS